MKRQWAYSVWRRRFWNLLNARFGAPAGLLFVNVARATVPCDDTFGCDDLGLLRLVISAPDEESEMFACPAHAYQVMNWYKTWYGYLIKCGADARIMINLAFKKGGGTAT